MIDIFLLTVPVYLLIALGYASVRSGYVPQEHIGSISLFVVRICLPALVFTAVTVSAGDVALNWSFLIGYASAAVAALTIGMLIMRFYFKQPAPLSWMLGLGMANSNSGFMGFPIASLVFGDIAGAILALTMIVENMIVIPLAMICADMADAREGSGRQAVRQAFMNFIRNPLVVAIALALVVRVAGLTVPEPLARGLTMLASVAPGVALFVVGGSVANYSMKGYWRRVTTITLGKLFLHPLLTFAALSLLPGVQDELVAVGVLFAAVPMLSIFPILAERHGGGTLAASALIVATIASFFTVSGLIWLVK